MQGSASGIDGLFAKDLLLCPPAGFAGFLNVILAIGHLPTQHCFCNHRLDPQGSASSSSFGVQPYSSLQHYPSLTKPYYC
ncbi:hypothetical protein AAHC03_026736 [Spirometra sp. Aus1]